jgi:hypothetical protein
MPIKETYVVTYENDDHRKYAALCLLYGFRLTVDATLRVGMRFDHPIKGHIVRLDREDEGSEALYEPTLMIHKQTFFDPDRDLPQRDDYIVPLHPDHYSDEEWRFLTASAGPKVSGFELLSRELYLWLKVRPYSLNTQNVAGLIRLDGSIHP